MSRKILVSLVSDQTIPNINFIKSNNPFDEYWFITTSYSEGESNGIAEPGKSRSNWIVETCNIFDKSEKIKVIEDDLKDISNKLTAKIKELDYDPKFTINLTCGTKMMSLSTYLFFKDMTDQIYYTPIGSKHFKKINTDEILDSKPISIDDYLKGYGIKFKSKQCSKEQSYVYDFFNIFSKGLVDLNLLNDLRRHYRGKSAISIEKVENVIEETESDRGKRIENLNAFLNSINFEAKESGKLLKKEIEFLTGGWFEEFIFYKIKQILNLDDNFIKIGVELEKSKITNTNDLDVVIVRNDRFIVIECKTGMKMPDGKITQLFNETVYKAAALKKNFGLNVTSYLMTLEDLTNGDLVNKADILGVKVIHETDIKDEEKLNKRLIEI